MKRVIFMCALIAMSVISSYISAQKELGIFNSLSVGVSAGTTGIGVDVATPVTPHFAIRGGVSFMPGIKISTDVDVELNDPDLGSYPSTLDLKGSMSRASGELLVNYYPFLSSSFFVTAGAYFGGSKLVKITGHSDELKEYVRPYLGVGFGRAVPKKRIGVQFELGVQFHGTPKVYTDAGILGSTSTDGDDSFTKIIDKLTVYPVMKLRFCGRLF